MTVHPLQGGLVLTSFPFNDIRPCRLQVSTSRFGAMDANNPLQRVVMPKRPNDTSRPVLVSARVTKAELTSIRQRATAEGLSVSEWGRTTLLRALHVDPVTRTMMAEFLAMRRIVLTLHTELRTGGKELSAAAIDRLVADTDLRKFALADRRIRDTLGLPIEEDPATDKNLKTQKENKQ